MPNQFRANGGRWDNDFLLKALAESVGTHEIRATCDRLSALELIGEWIPDVVLLDLGLPGMRILKLAREIRKREECLERLIVVLIGYDNDDMRRQAHEAEIDLYRLSPASITMIRKIFRHPQLAKRKRSVETY